MRQFLGGLLLLTLTACGAESGASFQILSAIPPNAECVVAATATSSLSGDSYDPRGFINGGAPRSYFLNLDLRNNLAAATSDPATSFSQVNRRPDANDIEVLGFDACWFRADPEGGRAGAAKYGAWESGVPDRLKCNNLPANQRRFVTASAMVAADGGASGISVRVLDDVALQSLYGGAFDPVAIPAIGGSTVGGPYYFTPADPISTPRNDAWGTYPHDWTARVVVQARATGKLQNGDAVQSNWFVFPVDVCVGCTSDVCGPTMVVAATCATTGTVSLTGSVVSAASCLPSQSSGTAPVCTDPIADPWVNCF
jgi:hypothetical protein